MVKAAPANLIPELSTSGLVVDQSINFIEAAAVFFPFVLLWQLAVSLVAVEDAEAAELVDVEPVMDPVHAARELQSVGVWCTLLSDAIWSGP